MCAGSVGCAVAVYTTTSVLLLTGHRQPGVDCSTPDFMLWSRALKHNRSSLLVRKSVDSDDGLGMSRTNGGRQSQYQGPSIGEGPAMQGRNAHEESSSK